MMPLNTAMYKLIDTEELIDEALDMLYEEFDRYFSHECFSDIDWFLLGFPVEDFSVDFLIGILTASLPAKNKLKNREKFFAKVCSELKKRDCYTDDLVNGLE